MVVRRDTLLRRRAETLAGGRHRAHEAEDGLRRSEEKHAAQQHVGKRHLDGATAHRPGRLGRTLPAQRTRGAPLNHPGPDGRLQCGHEARLQSPILLLATSQAGEEFRRERRRQLRVQAEARRHAEVEAQQAKLLTRLGEGEEAPTYVQPYVVARGRSHTLLEAAAYTYSRLQPHGAGARHASACDARGGGGGAHGGGGGGAADAVAATRRGKAGGAGFGGDTAGALSNSSSSGSRSGSGSSRTAAAASVAAIVIVLVVQQ